MRQRPRRSPRHKATREVASRWPRFCSPECTAGSFAHRSVLFFATDGARSIASETPGHTSSCEAAVGQNRARYVSFAPLNKAHGPAGRSVPCVRRDGPQRCHRPETAARFGDRIAAASVGQRGTFMCHRGPRHHGRARGWGWHAWRPRVCLRRRLSWGAYRSKAGPSSPCQSHSAHGALAQQSPAPEPFSAAIRGPTVPAACNRRFARCGSWTGGRTRWARAGFRRSCQKQRPWRGCQARSTTWS